MSAADILITPAVIWNAPVGEAIPDENIAYGGSWAGNWSSIAYTKTPLTVNREVSTFDAMVEQITLPVKRSITEEKVAFETVIAEFTAAHLKLAMGGNITTTAPGVSQVGYEELAVGGSFSLPELQWGFEGLFVTDAGLTLPVRVFIHRATAILNGSITFGKADSVGIPLRLDALADLTQAAGEQLLLVQKVTAPAT